MFSQASVILLTGGVSTSEHAGIHTPPRADTPQEQTPPRADTPPEQTPPGADTPQEQTPPREQTPLPRVDTPQSRHP